MLHRQAGFSKILLVVLVVIILLCGIGVWYVAGLEPADTGSTVQNTPQATTTDLAPQIPPSQKTAVLVMHADSSYEKFLVANTIVPSFLKSLAKDDRIISETPLPGK